MSVYEERIYRLIQKRAEQDKDFLLTNDKNIYYFTGLWDSNGYLLITKNGASLLVDFRYGEIAENTVTSAKVVVFEDVYSSINDLLTSEELLVEISDTTVACFKQLQKKLNCTLCDSGELDKIVGGMRIVKDIYERSLLKKAQEITEQALMGILPMVKPGVTEREISNELEHRIKLLGAEGVSFDLITITGKKTSLPHGVPSDDIVSEGDFFTFDIGSVYKGYHSDMTRTYAVGGVSEEMRRVYETVLNAHNMAMKAVKPGMRCSDIDKIAREYIYSAGFKGCFGHATGHGVGLDIHEAPTVSPKSDTVLKEGMVITVEPGIYLPDKFGVRIEDTVFVTNNGCESFASLSKELIVL